MTPNAPPDATYLVISERTAGGYRVTRHKTSEAAANEAQTRQRGRRHLNIEVRVA